MVSERYAHEVAALTDWFKAHLPTLTDSITVNRSVGTDSIESPQFKALLSRAFSTWLHERQYELSYHQMNLAFFAAYDSLKREEATSPSEIRKLPPDERKKVLSKAAEKAAESGLYAQDSASELEKRIAALESLVRFCFINAGYGTCGFNTMTDAMQRLFLEVVARKPESD